MTGRSYLAAIILTVFQIVVSSPSSALAPEDSISFLAYGEPTHLVGHRHYKRVTHEKVSPPVKQEVINDDISRRRGLELVNRIRRDLGTNPTHWPSVWCGRYLSMVTGRNGKRSVNLASDWQREGIPAPRFAVGSVGVSEGHVLVVAPGGNCPTGTFNSISGNSVGRLVSYMCANRSSYFSFRWVSVSNSQISAIPLPKPRPEFPPLPRPNPEPRTYEQVSLPPDAQPVSTDMFEPFTLRYQDEPTIPVPSPTFVRTGPFVMSVRPQPMQLGDREKIIERDEIASYLCDVYKRTPRKKDNTGDFTWKDVAAAKRMNMEICQYVIGGMARTAQKAFYKVGKKLDSLGIRWSILSAFRDDYRQRIAEGIKACNSCSLHGGSRWGGYGNGQAIDVTLVGDEEDGPIKAGDIFAKYGPKFGLSRPMPGYDPAHIQLSDRVAHQKPWKWFASFDKPTPSPIKVLPEPAMAGFSLPIPTPEKPVQSASINRDVPLTKHQKLFQLIREEAAKNGLDGDTLIQFAYLENGDEITTKSEMGLFGVIASERRRLKQRDNSLQEQVRVGIAHVKEDWEAFKRAFKHAPSALEAYTMHFLGEGAGIAVLKAPNGSNLKQAIDSGEKGLGSKALAANPGLRKLETVGAFKKSIEERLREARGVIRA